MKFYFVYILECSDKSYYTGITNDLERRMMKHQTKISKSSYTHSRLPVKLIWHCMVENPTEAIKIEKQIKGWSRRKKQAMIQENWKDLVKFSKNYTEYGNGGLKGPIEDDASTSSA
ncbi:GIY-YIG nuclease family protein [Mangrovimonas futianensis]|uniref:GIY-YIG nuclease family protein n=1 Tax=Mangrovimonas futianensis TaxID=2895523 RepID=UPI001E3B90CA|nr:GIY-YIG nuclease family protein [Mangrovimonas futianensis]MCF1421412.1 GIY-YIG nuclease family protein [Mangrovimonas futianensis]